MLSLFFAGKQKVPVMNYSMLCDTQLSGELFDTSEEWKKTTIPRKKSRVFPDHKENTFLKNLIGMRGALLSPCPFWIEFCQLKIYKNGKIFFGGKN